MKIRILKGAITTCLFLSFFSFYTIALGQDLSWKGHNLKSGIYNSLENFVQNNPELYEPLLSVSGDTKFKICPRNIDGLNAKQLEAKSIWGLCVNGKPYFRYIKCFYPIYQIGKLSTFYYVESQEGTYIGSGGVPYSTGEIARSKLVEKVIDLSTGGVLDQKKDAKKIIGIIKSDDFFKNSEIKKKNLALYLTQYNKRHRIESLVQKTHDTE